MCSCVCVEASLRLVAGSFREKKKYDLFFFHKPRGLPLLLLGIDSNFLFFRPSYHIYFLLNIWKQIIHQVLITITCSTFSSNSKKRCNCGAERNNFILKTFKIGIIMKIKYISCVFGRLIECLMLNFFAVHAAYYTSYCCPILIHRMGVEHNLWCHVYIDIYTEQIRTDGHERISSRERCK